MDVPAKPMPQTPVGPVKLTVGVEESRAQRHQRQVSRFRDRGGIFVPSARKTLVDILMGRRAASPKKSFWRSNSSSPSKRDKTPLNAENVSKIGKDDTVPGNVPIASPTKARKGRISAAPKGSLTQVENKQKDALAKSGTRGTEKASSGSEVTKAQPKRRGRPPKKKETSEIEQGSDAKGKSTKLEPPAPKKRTKSSARKSKAETVQISNKATSRLSTIVEEAESDESEDESVKTKKSVATKKRGRGKRKTSTEIVDSVTAAGEAEEDGTAIPLGKMETDHGLRSRPTSRAKKGVTGKPPIAGTSKLVEDLVPEVATKPDKRAKSDARSKGKPGCLDPNSTSVEKAKRSKPPERPDISDIVQKSSSSKASAPSTTRRKRQKPGDDETDAEHPDLNVKRVKATSPEGRCDDKGKQKQDAIGLPEISRSTCNASKSNLDRTQKACLDQGSSMHPSVPYSSVGTGNVKSKKRTRNPEDASIILPDFSPPKRARFNDADTDPIFDKDSEGSLRRRGANEELTKGDDSTPKVIPGRKPKLKENPIAVKKPPKQATKASKPLPKRTKGLPKRVLQRLKNSVAHAVDDEPDPIDFLS